MKFHEFRKKHFFISWHSQSEVRFEIFSTAKRVWYPPFFISGSYVELKVAEKNNDFEIYLCEMMLLYPTYLTLPHTA